MKKLTCLPIVYSVLLFSLPAFSQTRHSPGDHTIADFFYANGKLYVSVAVLVIIFSGVCIFLFNIDKKVSKIRKEKMTRQ